jgi:drug/metabolite transporter (DMT)-like permease
MHVIFNYVCAFAAVFIASCSQIILKKSANEQKQSTGGFKSFAKKYLNMRIVIAYSLLLVSMVVNVIAFTRIELKYAHIFDVSSIIWVTILAAMVLGERPNKRRFVAIAFIVIGSIVFCL